MSPRLIAALEYAKQGIKVFPCRPGTKFPCFKQPFENASLDPDIIKGWFATLGDCNIAFCPEDNGRCVADLDMKNGVDGMAGWTALPFEKPMTATVITPTGGLHYHYFGSLRATAGKIAPGIDTRGVRSLALLPPSITKDGLYSWLTPMEYTVPVPPGLVELARPRERTRLEAPPDLELDTPWNIDLAKAELARIHEKEGPWGKDDPADTYLIATSIKDRGISEELTADLMMEYLAEDERAWLETTVHNAYHFGQNAIGCKALPDPASLLADLPPGTPTNVATQERPRFQLYDPEEHARLPPLEYWDDHREKRILPRMPASCSVVVYGPRSSHKTGVVLKELVDAVLNKGAKVLYVAAEGSHGIGTARLPELMRHRGRPLSDLTGRWKTLAGAPDILNEGDMAELHQLVRDFQPNLIALDTGTRCLGAADINNTAVGTAAIKALEQLGGPWNATVLYITHPGPGGRAIGSSQQENQAYAQWRIEHDGEGVIRLHVEKMKDGEDGFMVPLRVKLGGVPVVVEMPPEERDRLTQPTHDDIKDMVWRAVYQMIQEGKTISATNRGSFGPQYIRNALKDAVSEDQIKNALDSFAVRGYLEKDKGGGYHLGTAAQAPDSLQ